VFEVTIISPKGQHVRRFELAGDRTVTIGRARDCDVVLSDPTVSRRHAEIEPGEFPGEWIFRDLGSTHGCFVDGERIDEVELRAGLAIRVGPVELRFENLASRIGRQLDRMLQEEGDGGVTVEIIGLGGRRRARVSDDDDGETEDTAR